MIISRIDYKSDAHEKYQWMKKHPIKATEYFFGIKLKWYQKIFLYIDQNKIKRKESEFEKILNKIIK